MTAVLPSLTREQLREHASNLYSAETRPALVQNALGAVVARLGAEKVIDAKAVEYVASLSTVPGLLAGKQDLSAAAAPYLAKARDSDGRKELVAEARSLAAPYVADAKGLVEARVLKPTREYVASTKDELRGYADAKYASTKEYAAPYVEKGLEAAAPYVAKASATAAPYVAKASATAAPYIAKLEGKRDEITSGKRYEAAMAKLAMAREHPAELASELRAKAVDLIKYDDLRAYRDHVMSAEFQADTVRLVKVELPAIAASAAKRGAATLKARAGALAAELEAHKGKVAAACAAGYELAAEVDVAAVRASLRGAAASLLAELQAEIASGVEHAKADGLSLADALARIRRVVGAVDRLVRAEVLSPILSRASSASSGLASAASPAAAEADGAEADGAEPVGAAPAEAESEPAESEPGESDDAMQDALEPADAAAAAYKAHDLE